jgi:hypothetical protein
MINLPRKRRIFDGRTGKFCSPDEMKPTIIYGLVDPRDSSVFYIGLTNHLYHRFKQHMLMAGTNKRKQNRIQAILDAHMLPWMHTLEVVDVHASPREREVAWIKAYRESGADLLNDEAEKYQEGTEEC